MTELYLFILSAFSKLTDHLNVMYFYLTNMLFLLIYQIYFAIISICLSDLTMTGAKHDGITGNLLVLLEVNDVANLDGLTLYITIPPLLDNTHDPFIRPIILLMSAKYQNI